VKTVYIAKWLSLGGSDWLPIQVKKKQSFFKSTVYTLQGTFDSIEELKLCVELFQKDHPEIADRRVYVLTSVE